MSIKNIFCYIACVAMMSFFLCGCSTNLSNAENSIELSSKTSIEAIPANGNTENDVIKKTKKSASFTNKYGTATTKCAHSGCSNNIASSGDTNCCIQHSNRCLECNGYIDEDALHCVDCIKNAVNRTKPKTHTCEECSKEGTYTITGISGQTEYYCYTHYKELLELYKSLLDND